MTDLFRIPQHPSGSYGVRAIKRDANIEISPYPMELTPHIRYGMPAALIVLGQLRVPLRHAIGHTLGIVAAAAADLHRHLTVEIEIEHGALARQERLRQYSAQHGAQMLQAYLLAPLRHAVNNEFTHLMRLQCGNAIGDALVRIGDGARSHIHLTARSERIEVKVEEDLVQRIGAVVGVGQRGAAREAMVRGIERYLHIVAHVLLPAVALAMYKQG